MRRVSCEWFEGGKIDIDKVAIVLEQSDNQTVSGYIVEYEEGI